jgi:hypothetical protein
MMLNEDGDLVLLDILCIFTFNYLYHLLKDIFGYVTSVTEKILEKMLKIIR